MLGGKASCRRDGDWPRSSILFPGARSCSKGALTRPGPSAARPAPAGLPVAMEQDPAGMEPENESLEATTSNPLAKLRAQVGLARSAPRPPPPP